MKEDELRHKIFIHSNELLQKLDEPERRWAGAATGFPRTSQDGKITIDSGIIADFEDWLEIYTGLSRNEITELHDRDNWEKLRTKAPVLIADLERAEEIAREMAARYEVNLRMTVNKRRAQFIVEINARDKEEQQLLREVYRHVDALFEAWKQYGTWYNGEERRMVVRAEKSTKEKPQHR